LALLENAAIIEVRKRRNPNLVESKWGRSGLEIQQLRHLIAAVECGNLLKAASHCNISQSGLSRSIASLEDGLGVQLLYRKPKGVEPTIFGLRVLARAHLILNEIARCTEDIRSIQACEIGDLTFGITQNYGYYAIPQVVANLNAELPGIHLTIETGGFLDLVERLKGGAIDFVFGLLGPLEDDEDLHIDRMREHHSRVVGRKTHPLAMKVGEVTPEELSGARWATLRSSGFQRNFINFFSSQGLSPPVQAVKTDSLELICQTIANSDLLAVLPPDVAREQIGNGSLVILDCDAPAEQTDVGLVTRKGSLVTQQRKEVLSRLEKMFPR
jgi:DNA-binding transcriptional LysR family regulator